MNKEEITAIIRERIQAKAKFFGLQESALEILLEIVREELAKERPDAEENELDLEPGFPPGTVADWVKRNPPQSA